MFSYSPWTLTRGYCPVNISGSLGLSRDLIRRCVRFILRTFGLSRLDRRRLVVELKHYTPEQIFELAAI